MNLRFSDDGPVFPSELVEALFLGEVVFLSGAGISAPQLPGFAGLVRSCFGELGLEMEPPERVSFDEGRFEETLGTLSRRLVDPDELTDVVCGALRAPADADLANHRTILRLSRDLENRPVVVTTNFDTLIERALPPSDTRGGLRGLSFAGQSLPQPGGTRFSGIIHLHGRIDDVDLDLERTRLVVTSAEYGDAYMRSGWASRFLFDLARCKTIVLVGYRAGDAPVRYLLNVLEADRERFVDLRTVYALDALRAESDDADPRWAAIAVEPLTYRAPVTVAGGSDHGALWRDLDRLAELVERPLAIRRAWAEALLRKDVADLTLLERERVRWLFGSEGSAGLWDLPALTISDPAWFDVLHEDGVLEASRYWVLAAWFARDFTDRRRFETAIAWCSRLGTPLLLELRRRISHWRMVQRQDLAPPWSVAWRLLAASGMGGRPEVLDGVHIVTQALKAPLPLQEDIERAVRLLTPALAFSVVSPRPDRTEPPTTVAALASLRMRVRDRNGLWELVDALRDVDRTGSVMACATEALRVNLETTREAGMLTGDRDLNDHDVPSVERHAQNEFRDGVVFLVVLLSGHFQKLAAGDPASARRYAEIWRDLPGRIGRRLWLHALRSEVFSADEAIAGVTALSAREFWSSSREMPLVLSERASAAAPHARASLEARILEEGATYFTALPLPSDDLDWRGLARDRALWLRLRLLRGSGALSDVGEAALADIEERNTHLRHAPEDRDFFGSYMSPAQFVVADASEIVSAKADVRLQVAKVETASRSLDRQGGWMAFCRSDPEGALDALGYAPLTADNASFWRDLLTAITFMADVGANERADCVARVFEILADADDTFLEAIVDPLVDAYVARPRETSEPPLWWRRLFRCALAAERSGEPQRDRMETWSVMPTGALARAVLLDIERVRKGGGVVGADDLDRLEAIVEAENFSFPALATMVANAAFVLSLEGQRTTGHLRDSLDAEDDDGRALRAVLLIHGRITPAVAAAFREPILRGVVEFSEPQWGASAVAAKILSPALAKLRGHSGEPEWAIGSEDAAVALRTGSPALREGAANYLADWLGQEGDPAVFWRDAVSPLLDLVWPRDRRLKDRSLTVQIVRAIVLTGDAFPEALKRMRAYLTTAALALHFIETSDLPERWPGETLDLLWTLRDRSLDHGFYLLAGLLKRIRAANPELEVDRRLQWMEQRAPRFE